MSSIIYNNYNLKNIIMAVSRQALYRQKQIEKLGVDEYRRIYNEKARARFNAKKELDKSKAIVLKPVDLVKPAESKQKKIKKGMDYSNMIVSKLYRKKYGFNEWNGDIDFLLRPDEFITFVKANYTNKNTLSNQINEAANVLLNLNSNGKYDMTIQLYKKISSDLKNETKARYFEHKTQDDELENITSWTNIKDLYKTQKGLNKVFMALISLMPPRRTTDYAKIVLKPIDETDDLKFNYLEIDDNGMPTNLIYNNYKTSKHYGHQKFKVPDDLKMIIRDYIIESKLKYNYYLFGNKANASLQFANITETAYGKPLTVNSLRKSFISDFLESSPSYKDMVKTADLMAHSLDMQQRYLRTDIKERAY